MFRGGDNEALLRLYQRHLPALYKYGYNLARDRALVEDAIQDLFLHLHQHRDRVADAQNVRAYLMQSLRNRLLRLLKKGDTTQPLSDAALFLTDTTGEPAWVQTEADAERSRRLRQMINKLPKRQREALYLLYFEQLSYAEAATVMEVDVKSVYNFVYKALTSLRETADLPDFLLIPIGLGLLAEFFEKNVR